MPVGVLLRRTGVQIVEVVNEKEKQHRSRTVIGFEQYNPVSIYIVPLVH
jgi:hypothetical protein